MTDANTITILRQQRDDAWAEYDRLRDRLASYERATIVRDESVPEWASKWQKVDNGLCYWVGAGLITAPAPDLRPDDPGPITLPIVDVD